MVASNPLGIWALLGGLALFLIITIVVMIGGTRDKLRVVKKDSDGEVKYPGYGHPSCMGKILFLFFSLLHTAIFCYLTCIAPTYVMVMVGGYLLNTVIFLFIFGIFSKKPYIMPPGLHRKKIKKAKVWTKLGTIITVLVGQSINMCIFAYFLNFEILHVIWVAFLGILYAIYVSYDVRQMAGNFRHHLQPEDYLMAAIIIHIDFIPLSFKLLDDLEQKTSNKK